MAEKRREERVLKVSLFLLEHSYDEIITKNMCSKGAIERLRAMGCGPPPEEFLQEKGKIHFPFSMTTEEFTNKLVKIYPQLQNQCYLLMRADKSNKLQHLDIASSSYNPEEINKRNLGQGKLYIRFATETEVTAVNCMPPPPKIPRIMPKPAGLILPNSVSNSAEALSVPAQNVTVSQATTSAENHHTLSQNTDTMSNYTETIFPVADDSLAEPIVQLAIKVISGYFQGLEDVSTNDASMLSSTNANVTPTSVGPHDNLQTSSSFSQSTLFQLHDNEATVQENLSSTTLHQHDVVNQVESFISSQPDFPGMSALGQNYSPWVTNIPPVLSSTCNVSETSMGVDPDQQLCSKDVTEGMDLLHDVHETSLQNDVIELDISQIKEFITDQISKRIDANGHLDVYPELFTIMESLYLLNEEDCVMVQTVKLHPVGKLKEFLDGQGKLDKEVVRKFEHHVTWLNLQQDSLSSDRAATALAKMLPSFESLEQLYLYNTGLDEVDVEKVLKALKSCKLKILSLTNNKVGARGATALAKMLPSLKLLEKLYLYNAGLDEVDVEKVLKALKSCKKLKELSLSNNKVGARGATVLAKMLPSLELLEELYLLDAGLDEVDVEKVLKALKSCKKLKILDLDKNKVGARAATVLTKMLPSFELLDGLYLSGAGLDEVDVEKVLEALKSCKLKELSLSNNKVGARGVTVLAKMLPSFELLEGLCLSNTGLDEVDVEKVVNALKSCKKLKKLDLSNNKVGARGATVLAKMLPSLELLEKLYLSNTGLDEVDVEKVLEALKSCKKLKKLDLGNNKVGARAATILAKMLPSFELLEWLDLFDAGLDEVDVEKVLKALKSCKKLETLDVGNNKVGARAATALAKMLPSFELLEQLGLFGAGLDEVDVEKVLKALKSCKKLKELNLGNNKVGARGATLLAEMLPSFSSFKVLCLQHVSLDKEVKTKLHATTSLCKIIW